MRLLGPLFFAQAWASSAGAQEHGASLVQLIFPLINFLIFLYLVKRYLLPLVKDHLRSRRQGVEGAIQEAAAGRERAETLLQDYRGRLARLGEEAEKIKEMLRVEGAREKSKLLAEAEDLARRLDADARFLAEQEVKAARQEVLAEVARSAREAAEALVQRHLTPADQSRLVDEFSRQVGEAR